jgi:hypothetical protein
MTDDDKALVERLRSNRPLPTLPHEAADRIEALSAENERLRELLTKSEALQDLAYYNGAKQYAAISAQSEDAARDWLNGGCGNRQRDAIAALGETK